MVPAARVTSRARARGARAARRARRTRRARERRAARRAPDRDGGGMASGDGEHRARERSGVGVRRKGSRGSRGCANATDGARRAFARHGCACLDASSHPYRPEHKPRIVDFPVRRSGGDRPEVQNLLTAFAVASRPLSPRAPRTPRGPVSHERQLADRSFSRPFHPTCLRRVDRGARPHRLSRIFQSSSDFLVSSSPFSIPRPPLDARSRVTPASDSQPTTGKRMSHPPASPRPRASRRAPSPPPALAAPPAPPPAPRLAPPPPRRRRRRTPAALKNAPLETDAQGRGAWRSWRTGGSGGTGRATDATTSAPARTTTGPSSSSSTVSARTPTTGATPSPRSPVAGSASTRCACSGTVGRPRWRSRTRWNTGARR